MIEQAPLSHPVGALEQAEAVIGEVAALGLALVIHPERHDLVVALVADAVHDVLLAGQELRCVQTPGEECQFVMRDERRRGGMMDDELDQNTTMAGSMDEHTTPCGN